LEKHVWVVTKGRSAEKEAGEGPFEGKKSSSRRADFHFHPGATPGATDQKNEKE